MNNLHWLLQIWRYVPIYLCISLHPHPYHKHLLTCSLPSWWRLYFSMHMYMHTQLVYIFIISNIYGAYFYTIMMTIMLLQYNNCITHTHTHTHTHTQTHSTHICIRTCTCSYIAYMPQRYLSSSNQHIPYSGYSLVGKQRRMLVLRVFVVWSYTDRLFRCSLDMT